jgi:glutamate N-acetyltransferase/amino-acid N-acetyltransferase
MRGHPRSSIRTVPGSVAVARGFCAAGIAAGIKVDKKTLDLGLVASESACSAAGCFTTNKVRACCVDRNNDVLPSGRIRAVIVNSGNANACTGKRGERDNQRIAQLVAGKLGCSADSVLTASTGVIGHHLPMDAFERGIPHLVAALQPNGGAQFSRAIMTTDTVKKEAAVEVRTKSGSYRIGGCCKGAGMISPKMATMLAFITTDACISPAALRRIVKDVVDRTFNNLTVDGDTSTNDMVLVLANGAARIAVSSHADHALFADALFTVCNELCMNIAADGEGATKRIAITVRGGRTYADAQKAARAIANSNLVKTAMFGNDPNWGRILAAIGYSGAGFDTRRLLVKLCGVPVCRGTTPAPFAVKPMIARLKRKVVAVDVDLRQGAHSAIAHTCDFSYDYVKINADYHT